MSLPAERRLINGNTFREAWNPAEYSGIEPPQRRPSKLIDRLCWFASAVLLLWMFALAMRWPS